MLRVITSELRHRRSRTVALLAGIFVATTAFAVLTGASDVQQLDVRGTIGKSFHSAYDILVRPRGSETAYERHTQRVRPNYLSGLFGGISFGQWRQIERVPGVTVAAPIANVGYVLPQVRVPVDLTRFVGAHGSVTLRARVRWISENGLTRVPDRPSYVYVTGRPFSPPGAAPLDANLRQQLAYDSPHERLANGHMTPVCPWEGNIATYQSSPFAPDYRSFVSCFSRRTGFRGEGWAPYPSAVRADLARFPSRHYGISLIWPFPFLLAAIDPKQEARLDHVDKTVVGGRYLRERDTATPPTTKFGRVPVLVASHPLVSQRLSVSVSRLSAGATAGIPRVPLTRADPSADLLLRYLNRQRSLRRLGRVSLGIGTAYRSFLFNLGHSRATAPTIDQFWTVGATSYRNQGAALAPRTVHGPKSSTWLTIGGDYYAQVPAEDRDTQFRRLTAHTATAVLPGGVSPGQPEIYKVGVFDPNKLPGFSPLTRLPLETYEPPSLAARDARTRRLLQGRTLAPNANLGGYLQQPPLMLTTLRAVKAFGPPDFATGPTKPISAIRVRVAGAGPDPVGRERIREAAERIANATHLHVDITAGSSPAPTALDLPAGRFGRPRLELSEPWVKKGVVATILTALDRKSLLLFALILVVCAFFVANAASAAVRTRRSELGILACLGWTRPKLFGVILGELAVIGLAAGIFGALISIPLSAATGVHFSAARAVLAVPAAMALSLLAGAWPAYRASRSDPREAVRPPVLEARRAFQPRGIAGMAAINLVRVPGRTFLGVVSLAIGVCALSLLLAARIAFHDVLVGTLLGRAISVQVRSSDYVAVVVMVALGAAAVADVLFLGVRERSRELATLRATGWDERALGRLIGTEGLVIGLLGSLIGAALGMAGAAAFAGALPEELVATSLAAAIVGTALAGLAAIVPAASLRRLAAVPLLAGE